MKHTSINIRALENWKNKSKKKYDIRTKNSPRPDKIAYCSNDELKVAAHYKSEYCSNCIEVPDSILFTVIISAHIVTAAGWTASWLPSSPLRRTTLLKLVGTRYLFRWIKKIIPRQNIQYMLRSVNNHFIDNR